MKTSSLPFRQKIPEIPMSPRSAAGNPYASFLIASTIGMGLCLLVAFLWKGEEPNKLHTLMVAGGVFCVAAMVVLKAQKEKWITSPAVWMAGFTLKFALTLSITYYAWWEPLAPEILRVEEVVPGVQDSNLYDYYAFAAAHEGILHSWSLLNFTWLSFGITGYLAIIYKTLGDSIAYVSMVNGLLSLVGLTMLSATLCFLFGRKRLWDALAFGGLIPSVAFYEATPAKEPLTNALYYCVLYAIAKLFWKQRPRLGTLVKSFAAVVLLAVVRANVVFMVLASNAWPLIKKIGVFRASVTGVICIGAAALLSVITTGSTKSLEGIFNLADRFEQTQGFVGERAEAGEGGLKQVVAEKLAPQSLAGLLAFSPLRAVIWFYLPYPFLVPSMDAITAPPTLQYEARLEKVRAVHDQAFVITGWLLVLATPFLIGAAWASYRREIPGLEVLISNVVGTSFIIGNLMFIMGRRYRTLIEPLIFATCLVAIHYRLGKRLCIPVYVVFIGGVLALEILRG